MIIHHDKPIEIGTIIRDGEIFVAPEGKYVPLTFQVIKEVSRKEYLDYCEETGLTKYVLGNEGPYYYLVSAD